MATTHGKSDQVRDQDGIPQGSSHEKNWTGQKDTSKAPGAHSRGQGAHRYGKQGPAENQADLQRGKDDARKK